MPKESIPSTGDPLVDAALERIRGKFTDLEDAMLVQLHLGKRAGERIKEHAQLIADHQAAIVDHEAWLKRHEASMARIDVTLADITEKANFLFDR